MRLLLLQNNSTRYNKNSTKVSIQNTVPSVSTVPIGIENFGNSCHLSAVLVAMSSSSVLKKYLLRHRFLSLDGRLDDLINSLRLVSGQRWLDGHLLHWKVFRPIRVANMLLQEGYNVYMPQDAEETWTKLCQLMENCLRCSNLYRLLSSESITNLFNTLWDSPLFGLEQQKTVCARCGYCRCIRLEPIRTIRVSLVKAGSSFSTLFECIDALKQPEILEISCDKCNHPYQYRYHQVVRLPQVLCIHVERNYWSQQRGRMMKTDQPLLVAKELHESIFYNPRCSISGGYPYSSLESRQTGTYHLKAIVRHHGTSFYGHYTCAVCVSDYKFEGLCSVMDRYPLRSERHWYVVNDTRVELVNELEVLLSSSIYMCIYEKEVL
ncbi:hypothetical protein GAYE_PCTG32G0816 [Galdieria yellowstonensis]|uniref:ubiquitinyl hydrolase 1 n=1 Tax=Galdieria yellowstonensis TaxID=3028027 RepID=A0AAV9I3G5_9RHOD|nr:hypothetical protein GAYE_PCTG32G0816 [Galdieria yellowstonensis]